MVGVEKFLAELIEYKFLEKYFNLDFTTITVTKMNA